jgi:hypothetical protein
MTERPATLFFLLSTPGTDIQDRHCDAYLCQKIRFDWHRYANPQKSITAYLRKGFFSALAGKCKRRSKIFLAFTKKKEDKKSRSYFN